MMAGKLFQQLTDLRQKEENRFLDPLVGLTNNGVLLRLEAGGYVVRKSFEDYEE